VAQLFSLGDFTFMKTQRILGILWLANCTYACIETLWMLLRPFTNSAAKVTTFGYYYLTALFILYLAGIVASVFMYKGVKWARWFVGMIACLSVIFGISTIIESRSFAGCDAWFWIYSMFCICSIVLFLLPRHESVA